MNEQQVTPQGAIWVKNFKLRDSISNFISTRNIECPKCKCHFQDDLDEIEQGELNETIINHVMTVKLKTVREKFIAIYNPKKSLSTHPDYFLYVYQAYTGAPAVYPFTTTTSKYENRGTESRQGQVNTRFDSHTSTGDIKSTTPSASTTSSTFNSEGKNG